MILIGDKWKNKSFEDASKIIVENDKHYIDKSDVLIAYIENYSAGTLLEIGYAYQRNIPIYIINPSCNCMRDFWLNYHVNKFFKSTRTCMEYIKDQI